MLPLRSRCHDVGVSDVRLREIVGELAWAVIDPSPARRASVEDRLLGLRGDEWLRLDDLSRRYSLYANSPLALITAWPLTDRLENGVLAVAASMSRDGRVRQRALGWLAGRRGPWVAAAVAVRVGDWVPQVTAAAVTLLPGFDDASDTAAVAAVMLRLRERRRARAAAEAYLAGLGRGPQQRLLELTRIGERAVRIWALEAAVTRGVRSPEALTERARTDCDPVVALWCARQVLADTSVPTRLAGSLLDSRRTGVRAHALSVVPDELLDRDRLSHLLLDTSGAVRTVARWRWTRRWGSPATIYQEALASTAPVRPRRIAGALAGLAETDPTAAATAADRLLDHPAACVRAVATQIVGRRIAQGHGTVEPLVARLADPSRKVARLSLNHLRERAGEVPADVLAEWESADSAQARRTALLLRQRLSRWERVRSDLKAMHDPDPDLAELARTDLLAWLQHDAGTTYGRPTDHQAQDLFRYLNSPRLTDRQRREILFVAGLPS